MLPGAPPSPHPSCGYNVRSMKEGQQHLEDKGNRLLVNDQAGVSREGVLDARDLSGSDS